MELGIAWFMFLASAAAVYLSAQRLAGSGEALAQRTGISRTLIGVVLLATATSLPEVATGVASVVLVGSVDLAAGGIFGSNVFNLAVIALMELLVPRAALLSTVSPNVMVPTLASGMVIGLAAALMLLARAGVGLPGGPVPLAGLLLLAAYVASLAWMARRWRQPPSGAEVETGAQADGIPSVRRALATYAVATAVVAAGGVGLAEAGDRIASLMGWSTSFVGTLFLAASTSMPEVSTSLAAVRLGSRDMAVANMVGSNLFNTGIIVFIVDLLYPRGSFLADLSAVHLGTLGLGVAMTAAVVAGIAARPRVKRWGRVSPEAVALVALFLLSQYLSF